ncbi:hypothetical protein AB0E62_35555 [Streptomyces sp. NPDC038707]|uniref:hypothetical protein n=1 Tax=unclassified Streptomyces TaxID=2593676 RepID=UPI0033D53720
MPYPNPRIVVLADQIALWMRQMSRLLDQLPADQALNAVSRVLHPDDSLLDSFTSLMETGARIARDQAERGVLPPEVCLALGRAVNELHSIGVDLDEHKDTLALAGAPGGSAEARPASPAPLVARRHR